MIEKGGRLVVKRILAVMLAAVLALGFTVPAIATGGVVIFGQARSSDDLNLSGLSTLLDVTHQTSGGSTAQFFRSYAFVDAGKSKVKWKEIKSKNLTVELLWDISKIVRKPGKLVLSSSAVKDNTKKNPCRLRKLRRVRQDYLCGIHHKRSRFQSRKIW